MAISTLPRYIDFLRGQETQDQSPLFTVPKEIYFTILGFFPNLKTLVTFSQVCKKCYVLNLELQPWKLIFQRVYSDPKSSLDPDLSREKICAVYQNYQKAKKEIPFEIQALFEGFKAFDIPETSFFKQTWVTANFCSLFYFNKSSSDEQKETVHENSHSVFHSSPIVYGRDSTNRFFIFLQYYRTYNARTSRECIYFFHENEFTAHEHNTTPLIFNHLNNPRSLPWFKKFFSYHECSIKELYSLIGEELPKKDTQTVSLRDPSAKRS